MKRTLSVLLAAVGGLIAGGATTLSLQAPAAPMADRPDVSTGPAVLEEAQLEPANGGVLLAWTAGGLPDGFADRVSELPGVEAITTVAGDRIDLAASHDAMGKPVDAFTDGWVVPLDALAIDPSSYAAFVPAADRATVAGLRPGTALLGSTSARLRRLDVGDTLTLADGHRLTIAGVVDDTTVAAAELVVADVDAAGLGIATDRFVLVRHHAPRPGIEGAIRRQASTQVRIRSPGETPWMRHGDAVLPQALVKDQFGEFAYRPAGPDRTIEQDPAWVADHIVTATLPVLGDVRCHRGLVQQLRGALQELADRGLSHLVDRAAFAGCHSPRLIAADRMPSRHAWGIALDVNADANPTGLDSRQDRRLVETFARWGFTWGGFWLVPDPMHVEYVGPSRPDPGKVVATE